MSKLKIYFVSGNMKKAEELLKILEDRVEIEIVKVDLPEYQGSPEEITIKKCKLAYETIKKPVLVEDTSLCFNSYNGLPGPYVKWFLLSIGNEGLYNMLQAYEDKSAYALTIIGYYDKSRMKEPVLFKGEINGDIVKPRGSTNFGWDCIFQPKGYSETFAEMDIDLKNRISHRYLCLKKVLEYFDDKDYD